MDIQEYIKSGVIESYVLGIATSEEVQEVEQMKQYPEVQEAIVDFSSSLEEQAFLNAVAPPPDLKERIMQSLSNEFSTRPAIHPISDTNTDIRDTKPLLTPVKPVKVWRFQQQLLCYCFWLVLL